jgi:hypothetical protein
MRIFLFDADPDFLFDADAVRMRLWIHNTDCE